MRLEDYERKVFDDFLGLYKNGEVDQVPEGFFSDALNIDYNIGQWQTRSGLTDAIIVGYGAGNGKIRRFAAFGDLAIGPLILILDDSGNLYTFSGRTGDAATSVKLSEPLATDFSAIKFLGKIYIAFHDGEFGLYGKKLKLFIPHPTNPALDEFRDAAGLAPISATPLIAVNITEIFGLLGEDGSPLLGEDGDRLMGEGGSGIVNAGTYLIAVAYETSSGFITQPGPKIGGVFTPVSVTLDVNGKIGLSNIPIGPAGTTKRRILITQAGLNEYFFLGSEFGGIINDNTTTTATLDFDDITDLVDSADYLFDLLEIIPAPLGLAEYGGRLCTFGAGDDPSIIRVSLPGEGEAFDSIDGIVIVNKDDGFSLRNCIVIRDVLYACKNLGIFAVRDNGLTPAEWGRPNPIDKSINTCIHGVAEFFKLSNINMARDWTLIADRSGILTFDGIARKPPITDNIDDIWQTMNWLKYHKLVIAVDEQSHKIYCAFPTGSSLDNNTIIMGDYNKCPGKIPEASSIKWNLWEFRPSNIAISPSDIGLFGVPPDTVPTLKVGSITGGGRIWRLDPAATDDGGFVPATSFVDNFNRANGKVNVGNTNWSPDVTYNSVFDILNNQVKITGSSGAGPFPLNNNVFSQIGDQFSELTFVGVGSSIYQGGVIARAFGSVFPFDRGYYLTIDNNHGTSKTCSVGRYFQSGPTFGFSPIFGVTLSNVIAPGDTFGLRAVGSTLSVIHNGALIGSGTDVQYATGIGGMFQGGGTPSNSTWDNFRYGPYPEAILRGDIESYFETSLVYWEPGNVHLFAATRMRVIGSGTLLITIRGEDGTPTATLPSLTLTSAPGREWLVRFNFQNEKARLKYRLTTGKFTFSKAEIFGKPVYAMRPA